VSRLRSDAAETPPARLPIAAARARYVLAVTDDTAASSA